MSHGATKKRKKKKKLKSGHRRGWAHGLVALLCPVLWTQRIGGSKRMSIKPWKVMQFQSLDSLHSHM